MSQATNRATMCAIAERAGVSRTTVSYVVNGQADRRNISLRTRERVIGIMQEMNYRPDILAQALQGVRTRTIGVLWSLTGYNPITAMVNEIALMAKRHNHASYLADHLNDPDATVNALDDFASRRVDAVVIDADAVLLRDKRIIKALGQFAAAVAISPEPVDATVDLIVHERGTLYLQAAQHLLEHGRTRLAVAMPKVPNHEPKLRAIQRAIAQHRGPTEPLLEIRYQIEYPKVEHSAQYILAALQEQFPGDIPFDALLCPSDQEAAYAIRWLQEKGLEVPRDVAVIGANNTEFGRLVSPPLATGIRHDEAVAAEIERMLFARLESPTAALQTSTVDMEFVWRQSAGN